MAARVKKRCSGRINACASIHAGHVFKLEMVATRPRVRVQISVHGPVRESSPVQSRVQVLHLLKRKGEYSSVQQLLSWPLPYLQKPYSKLFIWKNFYVCAQLRSSFRIRSNIPYNIRKISCYLATWSTCLHTFSL